MSFNIRDPGIEQKMRTLGALLSKALPEGWGFALFICKHGTGDVFYISSTNRDDMVSVVKEWAKRQEH